MQRQRRQRPRTLGVVCNEATEVSRKAAVCAASLTAAPTAAMSTPRQRSTSEAANSAQAEGA